MDSRVQGMAGSGLQETGFGEEEGKTMGRVTGLHWGCHRRAGAQMTCILVHILTPVHVALPIVVFCFTPHCRNFEVCQNPPTIFKVFINFHKINQKFKTLRNFETFQATFNVNNPFSNNLPSIERQKLGVIVQI